MPRYSKKYRSSRRRVRRGTKKPRPSQKGAGQFKNTKAPSILVPHTGRNRISSFAFLNNAFPLPAAYMCTHRYVSNQLLVNKNTGLNGADFYLRLNGLYAPQASGSGSHQPYGFDQMRAFYIKYCVWKVDINIKMIYSTNRSNGLALIFKREVNNVALDNLTLDVAQELSNVVVLQPGTADMEPQSFDTSMLITDITGDPRKNIFIEDDYSAEGNQNPGNICFLGMSVGDWNLNPDQSIRVVTTLTYHTRWSILANPGPS